MCILAHGFRIKRKYILKSLVSESRDRVQCERRWVLVAGAIDMSLPLGWKLRLSKQTQMQGVSKEALQL
jgi:hypothetical protein